VKQEIKYSPAYSLLEVSLEPNEIIVAEAGAVVYMTPQINVKTPDGSLMKKETMVDFSLAKSSKGNKKGTGGNVRIW